MAKFRILPLAAEDIQTVTETINTESPAAARRWLDDVHRCCEKLANVPGMGVARPEIGRAVRLFPLGQYVVLYREEAHGVDIVRLIHGKRDPESWL